MCNLKPRGTRECPRFIKKEFDTFLESGILAMVLCVTNAEATSSENCRFFVQKTRLLCVVWRATLDRISRPSGRRCHAVDSGVPPLTPLREWLAAFSATNEPVLDNIQQTIALFLIKKRGRRVYHSLVLDGVYRLRNGEPLFRPVAAPTTEDGASAGTHRAACHEVVNPVWLSHCVWVAASTDRLSDQYSRGSASRNVNSMHRFLTFRVMKKAWI